MASKEARDQTLRAAGARRIKANREAALRWLRVSSLTPNEVLQDVPEALAGASVYDVLRSLPAVGIKKAERACQCAGVWPFRRLDALTTHEREALLRELPETGDP